MSHHYEKWIGIRQLLERLDVDCLNNNFSADTGTPTNNIPPLDEVDEGYIVSSFHTIHFSSSIYPSTEINTIYDITLNSDSSISYNLVTSTIEYQHTSEIEDAI